MRNTGSRRRKAAWAAMVTVFTWGALAAQDEEPVRGEDAEERLLRAELLEVSTGDLARAMEVYRELADAEGVSEEVRARALLYLARSHRKRGELEKAREVLEDVVENHAREREIVRRARSFLAELREGRATERRFDWLGELRKNPEVQARIFDYIMDLVEPGEKAQVAARQLLTLGTIALPMLEESVERSRDTAHRRRIALVLANLGRYERLGLALGALGMTDRMTALESDLLANLIERAQAMREEERERFVAALRGVTARETLPARDFLLLRLGERAGLEEKLGSLERRWGIPQVYDLRGLLAEIIESEPGRQAVLARVAAPETPESLRRWYLEELHERARADDAAVDELAAALRLPEAVEALGSTRPAGRKRAILSRPGGHPWRPSDVYARAMAGLLESEDPLVLMIALEALALAPAGVGPEVLPELERFVLDPPHLQVREVALYALLRRFGARPETGPEVARIFREDYAMRHDTLVPAHFDEEDPRIKQVGELRLAPVRVGRKTALYDGPTASVVEDAAETILALHPHLLAGMETEAGRGLYRWIHGTYRGIRGNLGEAWVARLVDDLPRVEDPEVIAAALAFLMQDPPFPPPGEGWRSSLRASFVDRLRDVATSRDFPVAARRHAIEIAGERADDWFEWARFLRSDDPLLREAGETLAEVAARGRAAPPSARRAARLSAPWGLWLSEALERLRTEAPLPVLRAAADSPVAGVRLWAATTTGDLLTELGDPTPRPEAEGVEPEELIEVLAKLADDPDADVRRRTLQSASHSGHPAAVPVITRMIESEQDTFANFSPRKWSPDDRRRIARAAFESPSAEWRVRAARSWHPYVEDPVARLARALEDPDRQVREAALALLLEVNDVGAAPVLTGFLDDPGWLDDREWRAVRIRIVAALERLAVAESIRPLARLLGTDDVELRNRTLQALEEIRRSLEKRKEWKKQAGVLRRAGGGRQGKRR